MVELRRRFFTDSERRTTLAASVLDADWMATVRQSPGPYFFIAEAVFVYLKKQEVKAALAQIGLRLVESRTPVDVPEPLNSRLSLPMRTSFGVLRKLFPNLMKVYKLNLFAGQPLHPSDRLATI